MKTTALSSEPPEHRASASAPSLTVSDRAFGLLHQLTTRSLRYSPSTYRPDTYAIVSALGRLRPALQKFATERMPIWSRAESPSDFTQPHFSRHQQPFRSNRAVHGNLLSKKHVEQSIKLAGQAIEEDARLGLSSEDLNQADFVGTWFSMQIVAYARLRHADRELAVDLYCSAVIYLLNIETFNRSLLMHCRDRRYLSRLLQPFPFRHQAL
jgi:hypothetical protein